MERYDDALAAFDLAIALNPEQAWFHSDRGNTLRDLQRYDDALAAFDQAIALDPEQAWFHDFRGMTLRDLERYDYALAAFDLAIALNPEQVWFHSDRGNTCATCSAMTTPWPPSIKPLPSIRKQAWFHDFRGMTLRDLERHNDALAAFEKAVELRPQNDRFFYQLALTRQLQGQLEYAEPTSPWQSSWLRKVYQEHPNRWTKALDLGLYHLANADTAGGGAPLSRMLGRQCIQGSSRRGDAGSRRIPCTVPRSCTGTAMRQLLIAATAQ